jgi:type IV pilus assembly protein PilY1
MKPMIQLATSVVMLGGLLFQATSNATPTSLAEQPLKASVLAKPNVIFGLDDSGSMDSELMQYNNDGAFWWNYTTRTGWGVDSSHPNVSLRTLTTTHFNAAGDATSTWRKMVYLFPNGNGTGRRVYADDVNDHFPIMPTSSSRSCAGRASTSRVRRTTRHPPTRPCHPFTIRSITTRWSPTNPGHRDMSAPPS